MLVVDGVTLCVGVLVALGLCVADGDCVDVDVPLGVCEALKQTYLSAATAAAERAVSKMRALAMVPVKIWPPTQPMLPFHPMNTPGGDGIA